MDRYLQRINVMGTKIEKQKNYHQRAFDNYLYSHRHQQGEAFYPIGFPRDKVKWHFTTQDRNVGNTDNWADEKFVSLPTSIPAVIGVKLLWQDDWWIVIDQETSSFDVKQQIKIRRLNHRIFWTLENGSVCTDQDGKEGQWTLLQDITRFGHGLSPNGGMGDFSNRRLELHFQQNEHSSQIKTGHRIAVLDSMFRIVNVDIITRPGMISMVAESHFINDATDDMDVAIAGINPYSPDNLSHDFLIKGTTAVKPSGTYVFSVPYGYKGEWYLTGEIAKIVSNHGDQINIEVNRSLGNIGKTFEVRFKTEDDVEKNIEVRVKSPMA